MFRSNQNGKARSSLAVTLASLLCLVNVSAGTTPRRDSDKGSTVALARTAPAAASTEALGALPLSFEPNRGQTDRRVKFLSRSGGYVLFLTADEAVMTFGGHEGH